jgi:hypothetical protein
MAIKHPPCQHVQVFCTDEALACQERVIAYAVAAYLARLAEIPEGRKKYARRGEEKEYPRAPRKEW